VPPCPASCGRLFGGVGGSPFTMTAPLNAPAPAVVCGGGWGVAGWNITKFRNRGGLGTLLGPERTRAPTGLVGWVVSLVAALAGRLTHRRRECSWCGCGGGRGAGVCGCVLSVA
jgi:hypothetical protein